LKYTQGPHAGSNPALTTISKRYL